jgi:hypothetical protein
VSVNDGYLFTYWINGGSYTLIDNVNTFLKRGGMHGFSTGRIEVPMIRAPGMDGARVIGTEPTLPAGSTVQQAVPQPVFYTGPREFSIAIDILDDSLASWVQTNRAMIHHMTPYKIADALNPAQLAVTPPEGEYGAESYSINCWLVEWSDREGHGPGAGTVVATFLAPIPFWHLAYSVANSTMWDANPDTIINPGDAPLWPDIWVDGSAGSTIVGLHLKNNTTGKIWSTSQVIGQGGQYGIRVNMLTGEAYYTTDSWATQTSILKKMDTDAEFWPMEVGTNSVQWTSTSGTPAGVTMFHAWNYLSV